MTEVRDDPAVGLRISLEGRVAIVTGAGRGLGRAMAVALAGAGADVVVCGRSADQLQSAAEEIRALGRRCLAAPVDVTKTSDVDRLVTRTIGEMGRLDILVNNAGIVDAAPVLETTDEQFERVVNTNLRGAFVCSRAAGRHFVAQRRGKIVNISSLLGFRSLPGHGPYSATKAAIASLTRSLAVEWARSNVQVNAIAPGYFETDVNVDVRGQPEVLASVVRRIPARRMARPEEIGPLVVFLVSELADYITGSMVVIDGGFSANW